MNEIVVGILGILGSISSICFAYLAFRRNQHLDTKSNARHEGSLMSDIGYIKSSIDRMEKKLDQVEMNYQDLLARIVRVEELEHALEKGLRIKFINKENGIYWITYHRIYLLLNWRAM